MTEVIATPFDAPIERPVSPETAICNCSEAWTCVHQAASKARGDPREGDRARGVDGLKVEEQLDKIARRFSLISSRYLG